MSARLSSGDAGEESVGTPSETYSLPATGASTPAASGPEMLRGPRHFWGEFTARLSTSSPPSARSLARGDDRGLSPLRRLYGDAVDPRAQRSPDRVGTGRNRGGIARRAGRLKVAPARPHARDHRDLRLNRRADSPCSLDGHRFVALLYSEAVHAGTPRQDRNGRSDGSFRSGGASGTNRRARRCPVRDLKPRPHDGAVGRPQGVGLGIRRGPVRTCFASRCSAETPWATPQDGAQMNLVVELPGRCPSYEGKSTYQSPGCTRPTQSPAAAVSPNRFSRPNASHPTRSPKRSTALQIDVACEERSENVCRIG